MKALQLPFAFDPALLKADLAQVRSEEWVPHFNKAYYEGEWGGTALRSSSGATQQIYPDPARTDYQDTPLLQRTPYFAEVLRAFRCGILAARLLVLRAGSGIREHCDYNLSIEDGEFRVHVPVVTNPDVRFLLDGVRIPLDEGSAWYLNVNYPHSVVNGGRTDRVHLVFDCVVNDWVREMVARSSTLEFLRSVQHRPELEEKLRSCDSDDAFLRLAAECGSELGLTADPNVLRELIRDNRREMARSLL